MNSHDLTSITHVESCGNYIVVHFYDDRPKEIIRNTIKSFEAQNCVLSLVRIHKRFIVNLNHVHAFRKLHGANFVEVGRLKIQLPVSRSYHTSFLERYSFSKAAVTFVKNDPGYLFL